MTLNKPTNLTAAGVLAFAFGAIAFSGCSSDDDNSASGAGGSSSAGAAGAAGAGATGGTAGSAGTSSGTSAQVRVVHAAPGAPQVDIYVKGSDVPLTDWLGYGQSSSYFEVPEGAYEIEVRVAGAEPSEAPVYTTPMVNFAAGGTYTAIAAGDVGSSNPDDAFRVLPLEEGFGAAASGAARVRVVHAGADAPSVDLDVGDDGSAEISDFARFSDTGAAGIDLPVAGGTQVGILASGTRVTGFTLPDLPEGQDVFVVATGKLSDLPRQDSGFALLAVLPTGETAWVKQNPMVYALHASADAPAVDLFVGDSELVDSLAFGGIQGVQVPPGSYQLDIFAATAGFGTRPTGAPVASPMTPDLEAGQAYLAAAAGEVGQGTFQLIALQEGFALDNASGAQLRVVHASGNAPAVDIGTVTNAGTLDTPALVSGAEFGQDAPSPEGLAVPAAALSLGISAAGTSNTLFEFDVTTAPGLRAFALAAGKVGATGSEQPFQLLVVDASTLPWGVSAVQPK